MLQSFKAVLVSFMVAACAQTSVARFDQGATYAPTTRVEILGQSPNAPFEQIAILETQGAAGMSVPDLLSNMQQEAMSIGADAIIIMGRTDQQTPQQLMFNPVLGGYQTLGGYSKTNITGIAIKYIRSP